MRLHRGIQFDISCVGRRAVAVEMGRVIAGPWLPKPKLAPFWGCPGALPAARRPALIAIRVGRYGKPGPQATRRQPPAGVRDDPREHICISSTYK